MSFAILGTISPRACILCRQIARRLFTSSRLLIGQEESLANCCSEKDFRPKKALLVRKVTRYEYEKYYLKPELSEIQLQEYVRIVLSG